MNILKNYQEGANLTLLNTTYIYPKRQEDGKYDDGKMIVLFKDNDTGIKHIEEIDNPIYRYYEANEDEYITGNVLFIEQERTHEVLVPYKDLLKEIAKRSGNLDFYYENLKNRNSTANKNLHTLPNIFSSAINIEDAYRHYFDEAYKNPVIPVSKGYFDIETDTINMKGDFPEMGECPVNAISLVMPHMNKVSVFLLRDPENPQIEEFEKSIGPELFAELKSFIINHVGGPKYARKHKIIDFEYDFYFYDLEIDLLRDLFRFINYYQPDFMVAWNAAFDLPYIIERIKVLGYDPDIILSSPDAVTKMAHYYIDTKNIKMPAQKGDSYSINSKTIYLDQLVHFASRRKGQAAFDNLKLDNIGKVVAGIGKLDWSGIAKTFAEFIRKNYKMFVFYNIMDTIVQHCIENKVNDIDYVFNKCLLNNTRYSKCHRQTVYLVNRGIKEFKLDGFIMGNNINFNNEKPPKFPGALVGDPTHNSDYAKVTINGQPVNIFNNLDDFDFKSLYPSTMREFNIAPNTQIGMIEIPNKTFDYENPFNYGKYSRGGQFLEDFHSKNYLEFFKRWFHLAGYDELLKDMKEFFSMNRPYGTVNPIVDKSLVKFYDIEQPKKQLVEFKEREIPVTPFVNFYPEIQDFYEHINHITNTAQMDLDDISAILKRRQSEAEEDEELAKIFSEDNEEPKGEEEEE